MSEAGFTGFSDLQDKASVHTETDDTPVRILGNRVWECVHSTPLPLAGPHRKRRPSAVKLG